MEARTSGPQTWSPAGAMLAEMASRLPRRASFAGLALVFGLIAAALPGAVAGSWSTPVASEPLAVEAFSARVPATPESTVLAASRVVIPTERRLDTAAVRATRDTRPAGSPQATGWITRSDAPVPSPRPKSISRTEASSGTYAGRNHVWIPALGIDRSVAFFSCTSSAYPGDIVYRWGCAGGNNVYLFGHAYSVFKPLHDAYVRGALRTGMQVIYADGAGKVSTYAVQWWKVTTPDKGEFAYAAQAAPSLTLQTCVGAKNQYRLIVRLAKTG